MTTYFRKSGQVSIRVDMDDRAIARMTEPGGMVDHWTKGKTEMVGTRARREAPVRSGKLRSMIRVQQSRDVQGRYTSGYEVVSNAPYTVYVVKDTEPHEIVPRNPGGVLRFTVGTQVVFTRRVMHPGTKANDFLGRALKAVMGGVR